MSTSGRLTIRLPHHAARWTRLFLLGLMVGVLGGAAAALYEGALNFGTHEAIGRVTHLGSAEFLRFDWRVLLLPLVGGLASGVILRLAAPDSRGHGTDLVIRSFHHEQGDLPLRAPLTRAVANVAVLSCGGSTGPEGPSAALGGAIGSSIGRAFRLAPRERRILLLAGCAAAVGAIFRCPLGGALFATSMPYREEEFESDAIVPSFVASVIGYSVFMSLVGGLGQQAALLPGTGELAFRSILELIPYALLGLLCGGAAILFTCSLRVVEDRLVPRIALPRWLTPALGGLLTGLIACIAPQVMDGRYAFVHRVIAGVDTALYSPLGWAAVFAVVIVLKCVATACTVGSGGSGGALGPSVFLGGVVGAMLGAILESLAPAAYPVTANLRASLIAVGMGGVLAAVMRTPLAAIVMVTEMTGSYGLIVPLMLVCISAYVIGRPWGLNREQLRGTAVSPAHAGDTLVHLLESISAAQLMEADATQTVAPNASLSELAARIKPGTRPVFAVTEDGRLRGLVSTSDLRRFLETPGLSDAVIAADIMTTRLRTVRPEDDLYEALDVFRRGGYHVLPVVSPEGRWLGMLARSRVLEAVQDHATQLHQAMVEEHAGLRGMQQEAEIAQLMMGVSPASKERIQRLMVPLDAVGKSLRNADFRRAYGAQVIAVEHPDGRVQSPPDLDAPLSASQRLLVIVEQP